jgi:hypothetical protein
MDRGVRLTDGRPGAMLTVWVHFQGGTDLSQQSLAGWRRGIGAGIGAVAVMVLTSGCFLSAEANRAAPSAAASSPTPSTPAAPTAPTASAAADLAGSLDGRAASLAVHVDAVTKGVPPVSTADGPLSEDCGLMPATTEYVPVTVVFTGRTLPTKKTGVSSNLRVDLTLAGGSGVGLLDVTVHPSDYCHHTTALPSATTLQSEDLADEHQTLTVYVVERTNPTQPDPLRGVTLQLRNPRHHPDDIDSGTWTWGVQQVTAGSACPGDPNSLCLPLG